MHARIDAEPRSAMALGVETPVGFRPGTGPPRLSLL